jgi:hypothetical protein
MERRIIYETSSMSNIIIRNNNTDVLKKNLGEIRQRENKFLKEEKVLKPRSKRKNSSPFDLIYQHRIQKENDWLLYKITQHKKNVKFI